MLGIRDKRAAKVAKDMTWQLVGDWHVTSTFRQNNGIEWLCVCKCGAETWISGGRLRKETEIKCRVCFSRERKERTPPGQRGMIIRYNSYKFEAKKRGYCFQLSHDEFRKLTSMPCIYCGDPPSQESKPQLDRPWEYGEETVEYGTYLYNGIDRKNNDIGYVIENCVPCCGPCNTTKMDLFSFEEFKKIGQVIREIKDDRRA